MTTISARGWRRDEPGLVNTIEQPSLLPKAVELLAGAGIDEPLLIEQCRVPAELFRIVTARTPDAPAPREAHPAQIGVSGDHRVISLLERRHLYGQGDLIHLLYHGMTVLPENRQHSAHVDI